MITLRLYYETGQLRTRHKEQLQLLQALTGFDVWVIVDRSDIRTWKLVGGFSSEIEYVSPSLCDNEGTPISLFVQASVTSMRDIRLATLEAQAFENVQDPEIRKNYIPMTSLSLVKSTREMLEQLMFKLLPGEDHAHVREMVSMLDLPDLQRWFVETLQNT